MEGMQTLVATLWSFIVVKVDFKLFVPKGTFASKSEVPGSVAFKDLLKFVVPSNSSWSINFLLQDKESGKRVSWNLNPHIAGASTRRIGGEKSQWDLIMEALFNAGVKYSINNITGLIDPETNTFRSTNGQEVSSGYSVLKLIEQTECEVDLASGQIDKEVFGEKFKFLKGLNAKTLTIEHLGLNSGCYIWEQNFVQVKERRQRTVRGTEVTSDQEAM
jgi:hypothetical protein